MRKLIFGIALAFCAPKALAAYVPCAQLDLKNVDSDGMPLCPDVVKTNSAFAVLRCPLTSQNAYHKPTDASRAEVVALLQSWKDIRDNGKSKDRAAALYSHASKLDAQVCRVNNSADDSYLLVYAKPGVKDYSGVYMLLRETKASRMILLSPHNDTDGTAIDTPLALQHSHALALLYNGHQRGKIPHCSTTCGGPDDTLGRGDFSHDSVADNLGTFTAKALGDLYPKQIWFMIHGQSNDKAILYRVRSQNKVLANAWEKAMSNATGLDKFNPKFNADFTTEPGMNTNWYLKTEIPAVFHREKPEHLAKAFTELETYPWAYDETAAPDPAPEPAASPDPESVTVEDDPAEVDPALDGDPVEDGTTDEEADAEPADSAPEDPTDPAWKPKYHTFKGDHDYICLAMKCADGPPVSVSHCASLAKGIASFYKNQSHGKLIFHPRVEVVSVNQPYGPKCGSAVSDLARRKWGKALFALPRPYYHGNSNAGMRLANLTGYGNAAHETGHLLGLGHCGRYNGFDQESGKFGKLNSYGDGGATMSGLRGGNIRISQAIRLGWAELGKDYAVYDGVGRKEFTLRKETNIDGRSSGLQGLVVPAAVWSQAGEGRDMYVTFSQNCGHDPCMAVYLAANGGSQRLGIMGGEFHYTPSGLKITRLGGDSSQMKIAIEKAPVKK
jgi:hypothetical protein